MKSTTMNRRTFLKVTTVAGGGLLVGCSFSSPKLLSTPNDVKEDLGMWVRIGKDDKITLILPASEMGQQAHTCLLYTSPSPRDKRQSRMPSSA